MKVTALLCLALCALLWACSGASPGGTGGGTQSCHNLPCGNGSSIGVCTTVDGSGACTGVSYSVGSQSFQCASCSDCSDATSAAAAACSGSSSGSGSGSSSGGGSGGGSGSSSGGHPGDAGPDDGGRQLPDSGHETTTCSSTTTCGATGTTYQECTTVDSMGACVAIRYQTSDGQTFACSSCGSCGAAAQALASYCAAEAPQTTCGSSVTCGVAGVTYSLCTTTLAGSCEAEQYRTSDGHSFSCAACGDCAAASSSLGSYCQSLEPPVTSCGTASACGSTGVTEQFCQVTQAGVCQTAYYETSTGYTYACNTCSDCSTAVSGLAGYCATLNPVTSCGSAVACGTTGATESFCETTLSGVCQSAYYETSTGYAYYCASCSDCSAATTSLDSYCASLGPTTSCSGPYTCGTTGVTYDYCETSQSGVCQTLYYTATTGYTYTCNSCSDCTTASADMNAYCASLTSSCGTCATGYSCCNCGGTYTCEDLFGGIYTCADWGCQ